MPEPLSVLLLCGDKQLTQTLTVAAKTAGLVLHQETTNVFEADLVVVDQRHLSQLGKMPKNTILICDSQNDDFIATQLSTGICDVIPATQNSQLLSHKLKQQSQLITAEYNARAMLIQTLKLRELGELIGLISHEIASPLGNVNTAVSFLLESSQKVNDSFAEKTLSATDLEKFLKHLHKALTMCVKNAQNAGGIINSFRSVAASQCLEQINQFYLHRFIDDIVLSLKSKLKKLPHEIHIAISESIHMTSDSGAFAQVISALINKSIRHGFENTTPGKIIISAREEKQNESELITLDFIDNGKGMAPEVLGSLLDSQHTGQGNHLTCAMLKQIVEQNLKGTMQVVSEPGKGTHFTLTLLKHLPQSA